MNLIELYEKTPVEQHQNIKVSRDRVFVRNEGGGVDEYLVDGDEMWLIKSDKEIKDSLARLESAVMELVK